MARGSSAAAVASEPIAEADRARRVSPWAGVALVALAFALYGGVLGGDYVFDGAKLVRDNPLLLPFEPLRIAKLDWWAGTGEPGGLYRPVALLWLAALRALGGGGAELINAANVALHGLVAWLHFFLLARFLGNRPGALAIAWTGALIALVHPLNVEVVAGQVGAADLLASAFALKAVLVAREGTLGRSCYAALLAALAVLSKESGVFVVPLAVLFQALRADAAGDWKPHAGRALAWSLVGVAAALACRLWAIGSLARPDDPVYAGFGTAARVASACAAFATYSLPLLVAPWRQLAVVSHQDVAPASGFGDPRALAGAFAIALLAVGPLLALRRGRRELAFGGWLFLAAWLPTSNLFFSSGALAASRFFYAGLIGLCLPLAFVLHAARSRSAPERALAAAVAGWFLLALSVVTWRECAAWRTESALLEAQVARAPDSAYGLVDLATSLAATDPERATALFTRALDPTLPSIPGSEFPPEDLLESAFVARTQLAQLARSSGDLERAENQLRAAGALAERGVAARKSLPFRGDWLHQRAYALQQLAATLLEHAKSLSGREHELALVDVQRALDACDACEPEASETIRLRSMLLQARGDPAGRRRLIEEAWTKRPQDALLRILWANELRQSRRVNEALALELDVANEAFDAFDPRRALAIAKEAALSTEAPLATRGRALLERLAKLAPVNPERREIAREATQQLFGYPEGTTGH